MAYHRVMDQEPIDKSTLWAAELARSNAELAGRQRVSARNIQDDLLPAITEVEAEIANEAALSHRQSPIH
jgi:hypothetical protein